jgi:hypothetical protein
MPVQCIHSCKGLCAALDLAQQRENDAIRDYRRFQAECDYPDVRDLLTELIAEREHGLRLLAEKRQALEAKFDSLDRITDSFR